MISAKLQCVCYLRFLDNQTKELSKDDLADTLIWLFYKFVSFGGNWNKLDKIVWNRLVVILFVSRVGLNFLCLTNPVHRLLIYSGTPTYTLSILLKPLQNKKGQKKFGVPEEKQSFYKEKDCFLVLLILKRL